MNKLIIAAQLLGIAGTVFAFISFQCKNNKTFFCCQGISGFFFSANFLMLGAFTGCILNLINIFRSIVFAGVKTHHRTYMVVLLQLMYLAAFAFTYNGYLSVMVLIASLVSTFLMCTQNGKIIRIGQLLCVSPLWLAHNIITGSIGGILCESFNIASVIIYGARQCIMRRKQL